MLVEETALNAVDCQVNVVIRDGVGAVEIDQRRKFLEE